MTSNEKIVNYKVLDLIEFYNFDINFSFIRNHIKKLILIFSFVFYFKT
jgi:hypothetical protein